MFIALENEIILCDVCIYLNGELSQKASSFGLTQQLPYGVVRDFVDLVMPSTA